MAEDLTAAWAGGVPDAATVVAKNIEKFSATPYPDNPGNPHNTWTIGYGSIRDASGQPVAAQTPAITEPVAYTLLIRDMTDAAGSVRHWAQVSLLVRELAPNLAYSLAWSTINSVNDWPDFPS